MGAVGYIASGPEFLGKGCEDMLIFAENNQTAEAMKLHFRLCESYRMLTNLKLGSFRAVHKYALNFLGKPAGYPARPVAPLSERAKQLVRSKMRELGFA
jgi:4-hydroxy-tetrahydrodipicolinate synthase